MESYRKAFFFKPYLPLHNVSKELYSSKEKPAPFASLPGVHRLHVNFHSTPFMTNGSTFQSLLFSNWTDQVSILGLLGGIFIQIKKIFCLLANSGDPDQMPHAFCGI